MIEQVGAFTKTDGRVLEGVSATTLWTLRDRALEASRPDGIISDPWAVRIFEAISYDYDQFGRPSQFHALRARAFDIITRQHLVRNPDASVVALAEGLQTSFWRLGRNQLTKNARWYSIDLPPVVTLRELLLPADTRIVNLPHSALNPDWLEAVGANHGVFITAEGLMMYLQPEQALSLIQDCARHFPGATMVFDSNPHWLSRRARRGLRLSDRYTTPPLPFALSPDEGLNLVQAIPEVASARDIRLPAGRGMLAYASSPVLDWRPLRRLRPSMTIIEFAR